MARPLDPMTVIPVSTRLPVEAANELRQLAADSGTPLGVLVRQLLLKQLDEMGPNPKWTQDQLAS